MGNSSNRASKAKCTSLFPSTALQPMSSRSQTPGVRCSTARVLRVFDSDISSTRCALDASLWSQEPSSLDGQHWVPTVLTRRSCLHELSNMMNFTAVLYRCTTELCTNDVFLQCMDLSSKATIDWL